MVGSGRSTVALALLLLLFLPAGLAATGTWDTVDNRDAPRTTSAADLDLALNNMDAQAANMLLSSGMRAKGALRRRTRRPPASTSTPAETSETTRAPSPSPRRATGPMKRPWSR